MSKQYYFRKFRSKIYCLCFLPKSSKVKDQVYFHFIKMMFLGENNFKNKFIHFVNTPNEISLFLDRNSYDKFLHNLDPEIKDYLNIDPTCFRATEMYSVENDIHTAGITSMIAGVLAKEAIPIIYTNSFNSSFILVPEEHFSRTCSILQTISEGKSEDDKDD